MKSVIRQVVLAVAVSAFAFPAFATEAQHTAGSAHTNNVVVAGAPQETVVNINTADVQTLLHAHIKGIGKKRAADIVAYREQHGAFKSLDDLKNIKGISEKIIDANRARLTVG